MHSQDESHFVSGLTETSLKRSFGPTGSPSRRLFLDIEKIVMMKSFRRCWAVGMPKNGYATYVCGKCGGEQRKVPFSCKSCFCLSCAKVYTDRWAARIEAILFPGVAYRHTVLTVPDELRGYFYREAKLLSELMRVGIECLADTLRTVLRRPVEGGYIVVLQTNGRSGSYNPHLHIIMTSGGIVPNGRGGYSWVTLKYFPYEILHKKWQYHLFRMLKEQVPTREMQAKIDELYRNYPDGLVANIQKGEVPQADSGVSEVFGQIRGESADIGSAHCQLRWEAG